jgi:hypothetical protein
VRWLLFENNGLELVVLSKPFKTKKLAEKANIPTSTQGRLGWAWLARQASRAKRFSAIRFSSNFLTAYEVVYCPSEAVKFVNP